MMYELMWKLVLFSILLKANINW